MKEIIIGNRIPFQYFRTSGFGESDITQHAGSYHLALKGAGIERANIMTYSSILPKGVEEIKKPTDYEHGEVMECIMAVCHGKKGDWVSAGIIHGTLYDKITGEEFGGLVCENTVIGMTSNCVLILKNTLEDSLNELYKNGFSSKYYLRDIEVSIQHDKVGKRYGTVLCALCFTSYKVPIIHENKLDD